MPLLPHLPLYTTTLSVLNHPEGTPRPRLASYSIATPPTRGQNRPQTASLPWTRPRLVQAPCVPTGAEATGPLHPSTCPAYLAGWGDTGAVPGDTGVSPRATVHSWGIGAIPGTEPNRRRYQGGRGAKLRKQTRDARDNRPHSPWHSHALAWVARHRTPGLGHPKTRNGLRPRSHNARFCLRDAL